MWARLPSDLIVAVAERLPPADFARIRAVCRWWDSSVKGSRLGPRTRPCFPWVYPWIKNNDGDGDGGHLSFFNGPDRGRYYRFPLDDNSISLRSASTCVPFQQRDGWVAFLLDNHLPLLVNPLSGTELPLPSFRTIPRTSRDLFFGSGPHFASDSYTVIPCLNNNVAFALYGHLSRTSLAFAAPGDDRRTCVVSSIMWGPEFTDVVCHQGKFYALYDTGELLAFDIVPGSSPASTTCILARNRYNYLLPDPLRPQHAEVRQHRIMFLASSKSSGDLLHIMTTTWSGVANDLVVMKFDENKDGWAEIDNLDGLCMFLDESHAALIPPQDLPAWTDRDCVYFAGSVTRNYVNTDGSPKFNRSYAFSHYEYWYEDDCVADVRVYKLGTTDRAVYFLPLPPSF